MKQFLETHRDLGNTEAFWKYVEKKKNERYNQPMHDREVHLYPVWRLEEIRDRIYESEENVALEQAYCLELLAAHPAKSVDSVLDLFKAKKKPFFQKRTEKQGELEWADYLKETLIWAPQTDPATFKTYYFGPYNTETGDTVWDHHPGSTEELGERRRAKDRLEREKADEKAIKQVLKARRRKLANPESNVDSRVDKEDFKGKQKILKERAALLKRLERAHNLELAESTEDSTDHPAFLKARERAYHLELLAMHPTESADCVEKRLEAHKAKFEPGNWGRYLKLAANPIKPAQLQEDFRRRLQNKTSVTGTVGIGSVILIAGFIAHRLYKRWVGKPRVQETDDSAV